MEDKEIPNYVLETHMQAGDVQKLWKTDIESVIYEIFSFESFIRSPVSLWFEDKSV